MFIFFMFYVLLNLHYSGTNVIMIIAQMFYIKREIISFNYLVYLAKR